MKGRRRFKNFTLPGDRGTWGGAPGTEQRNRDANQKNGDSLTPQRTLPCWISFQGCRKWRMRVRRGAVPGRVQDTSGGAGPAHHSPPSVCGSVFSSGRAVSGSAFGFCPIPLVSFRARLGATSGKGGSLLLGAAVFHKLSPVPGEAIFFWEGGRVGVGGVREKFLESGGHAL